jgi:hypothetical protein
MNITLAILSLSFLSIFVWNLVLWKRGVIIVQHRFICKQIEKYITAEHKVPINLNDVNGLKQLLSEIEVAYDPNAWQQAKMPLLQTPLFFSNIVTFGDLSHTKLNRWQTSEDNK